jgi:hypothetical protein
MPFEQLMLSAGQFNQRDPVPLLSSLHLGDHHSAVIRMTSESDAVPTELKILDRMPLNSIYLLFPSSWRVFRRSFPPSTRCVCGASIPPGLHSFREITKIWKVSAGDWSRWRDVLDHPCPSRHTPDTAMHRVAALDPSDLCT